jgi:hypothetical protein
MNKTAQYMLYLILDLVKLSTADQPRGARSFQSRRGGFKIHPLLRLLSGCSMLTLVSNYCNASLENYYESELELLLHELFTQRPQSLHHFRVCRMGRSLKHLTIVQQNTMLIYYQSALKSRNSICSQLTIQSRIKRSDQNRRSALIVVLPERARLSDRLFAFSIEVSAQASPYRFAFVSAESNVPRDTVLTSWMYSIARDTLVP